MIKACLLGVTLLASAGALRAADALPPFTVGYEPGNAEERGLWMEADDRERRLRDSSLTIRDEALNAYVKGVLCRTVGEDRCRGVRIYIVRMPAFNANMAPNGSMVVWTGLLLRVRNEAELAMVLGHEFAHFELRHTLSGVQQARRATNVGAWLAVLGGLTNTNMNSAQLSLVGSMTKFSRDQEQAADLLGFRFLAASDYPTGPAAEIWRHAMAEQDAATMARGRKPKQSYQDGFFDSHPTSARRADYLEAEARKAGDSGRDARASAFRAAMAPYMAEWLDAQVKLNDFGATEYLLQQMAANGGWTGELLFARGELYRMRGNPRDLTASVEFYRNALAAGYDQPQLHRNMGLALLRTSQPVEGKAALADYLRLSPDANDAKAIQALMAN